MPTEWLEREREEPLAMKTRRTLVAWLALALVPALLQGQAQNERPPEGDGPFQRHPEAREAISELKSPYCPGLMLEVCPSAGGAALRDTIANLAEDGWDADRIVEWVVGNHGEEYRALPKRNARGFLAWAVPPLIVVLGAGVIVVVLRRMREAAGPRVIPEGDLSDEDEAKLDRAMAELAEEEESAPLF